MASVYDTYGFTTRVNYAVECIAAGGSRTQTRSFYTTGEMYDSDLVVVAVYRRSLKNAKLAANIWRVLNKDSVMKVVEKYADLTTRQLKEAAFDETDRGLQSVADRYPQSKEKYLSKMNQRPK